MKQHLSTIRKSSRELLGTQHLVYPVRELATAVWYGAELISQHRLDDRFPMPCFERALFRLCRIAGHPLCGAATCPSPLAESCSQHGDEREAPC